MAGTKDRIFISYSRKDEAFARKLAIWLNKTLNMGIWIDVDDIPPGVKWSAAIQDGLDHCEVMVVIITPESMESINVEDEWQYFIDQGKPVVPILLRTAPIPYQLRRIQYIDFSVREEANESLRKLLTEVRHHLNPLSGEGPSALAESHRPATHGIRPTRSKKARSSEEKQAEAVIQQSQQALRTSTMINVVLALLIFIIAGGTAGFAYWAMSNNIKVQFVTVQASGSDARVQLPGTTDFVPVSSLENGNAPVGTLFEAGANPIEITMPGSSSQAVIQPDSGAVVNDLSNETVDLALEHGNVSVNTEGTTSGRISTPYDIDISANMSVDVQIDETSNTVRADCYEGNCTITDAADGRTRDIEQGSSIIFNGADRDFDTAEIVEIPGAVAFTSYRHGTSEIYLMRIDGSNQTRLTNNSIQDLSPSWSPDGTRIAFQTYHNNNAEIAIISPDGKNQTILTNSPGDDTDPAWSPTGDWIAFVSSRDGNQEIYIMDPEGNNVRRITENSVPDFAPTWSPDGMQIGFVSRQAGNEDIFSVSINGDDMPVNLTRDPSNDSNPAWSPDGSKIAFDSQRFGSNIEVLVMNADGSDVVNLSNHTSIDFEPTWSPDGTQVMFASQRAGNNEIFIVPIDLSSEPLNLTQQSRTSDRQPAWLPLRRAGG